VTATKRSIVSLPLATQERVEAFRDKNHLSLSAALKMLITEGLDAHSVVLGEAPSAQLFCGCDPEVTCAAAFNRKFEGQCRLAHVPEMRKERQQ
jgi:hypothetical protein